MHPAVDPWLEHVPMPAYLFRLAGDDFALEAVSAAALHQHPEIAKLFGHSMLALYRDQPQAIEDARRCMREQQVVRRETAVRRYDRFEAHQRLQLTYVPLSSERMVIYSHELEPTSTARTALRESEERNRCLIESMPVGLLYRDARGVVIATNDVAVSLLGFGAQAELLGRTDLLQPGYRLSAEDGSPATFDALPGVDERARTRLLGLTAPDGSRRWARVSSKAVRGDDGSARGAVSTLTEVTDRVVAQQALAESSARLELALEAAQMGSWEFDADADTGHWAPNLSELFHMKSGEKRMNEFLGWVHPDDRARVGTEAAEFIAKGRDGDRIEQEYRLVGTDGVTRWARLNGRLFRGGGRTRIAGTAMDITERRRLEDELRLATRMESIGRLAGGVAHDFNNLLAAMLGSMDLVEHRAPTELRDDLATIRQGAERARDLTQQLLAFARRQPVKLQVLELGSLVNGVERMLRRLVGENIELKVTHAVPVSVRADLAQLEQVLVNLAVNARDAMPAGGRLQIRVGRIVVTEAGAVPAGDYAQLEVIDTGSGMDEDTRRRAFEPFFTTKENGTGLGLASTYGTVRQHGGHLVVESEPNRGSTFKVYLPRVEDATARARVIAETPKVSSGCVLVVDDNELVLKSTTRMLKRLGYQVLTATSGAEALRKSSSHSGPIDCVVCDVSMPDKSGPEVVLLLREARAEVGVVFASGYPAGRLGDASLPEQFLPKPFSITDLATAVSAVIETRH